MFTKTIYGFVNKGFKILWAIIGAAVILIFILIVVLGISGFLSSLDDIRFKSKAQLLLSNDHVVETTVGDFYGIRDDEVVCLISSWGVNGEMPQNHFTDYTALEALDWSVEELPGHIALLDFFTWDFMDDWVFSINQNKRRGFLFKLWYGGSNSRNSEYGCYSPSTKILISRRPNRGVRFEMPAFDRGYEKQISELLKTENSAQISAIEHFGTDATYICFGLRTNDFGLHLSDFRIKGRQAIKEKLLPPRMGWGSEFIVFYSQKKEVLHVEEFDRDLAKGRARGCFTSGLIFEFFREGHEYHLNLPNMEKVRIN